MEQLLIGAHTSIAGGVHNALLEGQKIGATTIQLFTANQRRWVVKALDQKGIDLWEKTLAETNLQMIMSHDSYLINLGAPDLENLHKSQKAFREEALRCKQLKLPYLNFHPGAALCDYPQNCLDQIVKSLLDVEDILGDGKLRLILETTAGQGSSIGRRFEEIAYIFDHVHTRIPVGVCIDTCHIFVAGYDIRTKEGWDATLKEFDRIIGLKNLYAFHLNDSVKGLGSRVDRHAPIGEGLIGLESFRFLMKDPRTRNIPKYLETPGGLSLWEKEIKLLRELAL